MRVQPGRPDLLSMRVTDHFISECLNPHILVAHPWAPGPTWHLALFSADVQGPQTEQFLTDQNMGTWQGGWQCPLSPEPSAQRNWIPDTHRQEGSGSHQAGVQSPGLGCDPSKRPLFAHGQVLGTAGGSGVQYRGSGSQLIRCFLTRQITCSWASGSAS